MKTYVMGDQDDPRGLGRRYRDQEGRVCRDHGAVGVGQIDADEPDRLPGFAHVGAVLPQRATWSATWTTTSWRASATRKSASFSRPSTCWPRATALHNVELPLIYAGVSAKDREERAKAALRAVDLEQRMLHKPNELSGGQRQRVAVARALVNNPSILLADEPTGSLDTATGNEIMALFERLHEQGNTIVLVTHEHDIALHAQRVIHIRDGKVERDEKVK